MHENLLHWVQKTHLQVHCTCTCMYTFPSSSSLLRCTLWASWGWRHQCELHVYIVYTCRHFICLAVQYRIVGNFYWYKFWKPNFEGSQPVTTPPTTYILLYFTCLCTTGRTQHALHRGSKGKRLPSADGLVHFHDAKHIWRSMPVVCSRSWYSCGSLDCARQCAMRNMQLHAHATVGLAVVDKGPLRGGSTCNCTGRWDWQWSIRVPCGMAVHVIVQVGSSETAT